MKWFSKKTVTLEESIDWSYALAIPLFADLDDAERCKLQALARVFLQQKRLVTLQDLSLTPEQRARIALLCCLPILNIGLDWLAGFHDVLIYPAPFIVEDEWQDAAGIVHRESTVHSGQSWHQGPIILNWQEIEASFAPTGFNLVIHEVAHKIDLHNTDEINGIPAIPLAHIPGWESDILQAMATLEEQAVRFGEEACCMDPYAATSPEECFAVLSEYFFSDPRPLVIAFPSLYRRFCQFYRQDPYQRRYAQSLNS